MVAMRTLVLGSLVGTACGTMHRRELPAGILGEMAQAEGMLKSQLKGTPKVLDEEMRLLHGAEDIARKNKDLLKKLPVSRASGQLLQSATKMGEGMTKDARVLETAKAEVEQLLKGHPAELHREEQALNTAVEAAQHLAHPSLVQRVESESTATSRAKAAMKMREGMGKDAGVLETAKAEVEQLLKGHPAELHREEQALNTAVEAAQHLAHPSLVQNQESTAMSLAKTESTMAVLEKLRESSMTSAVQEHRLFATTMGALAGKETQGLAQLETIKDAVAVAFAGKDSKGVKVAMEVGEMLDSARDRQQAVAKVNSEEAARAAKEASQEAAALAQTSTEGKIASEERTYMSEATALAADDKVVLGKFSGLKGVVAQAFAGRDSKAIEKAMEVGELLDEARRDQQEAAKRDQDEVASVQEIFNKLHTKPHHASLAQQQHQRQQSAGQLASTAKRLKGQAVARKLARAAHEHRIVDEEERVELAVRQSLGADHRAGAAAAEREVVDAIEKAKRVVQRRA